MPGQVKPAFIRGHIGDVTYPHGVGLIDLKLLFEYVSRHRQIVVGISGYPEFPLLPASQPQFPADTFEAANPDYHSVTGQLTLQSLCTVGLPGPAMCCPDSCL